MYVQHFGLEHEPFSIAPDPRYLYMSERHREALAHLLYGLGGGGGFVLLTGEIGAGKTTVCRCFLEQVPANCQVAYVFNPKLTVIELLGSVCEEFHVELPAAPEPRGPATVKTYLDPLNRFLLDAHAAGRNSVLVIDEAQLLAPDVLEQLRLLTNLETSERKLLQIVLIGQPELRDMLAQPGLEQLAQRVVARYHLGALSEAETGHYLQHRLVVAGLHGASPLGPALVRSIHRLSGGVPRRINLLCDRALLGAYSQGLAAVDAATLAKAAREVDGEDGGPRRARAADAAAAAGAAGWWRFAAGAGWGGLVVLAAGVLLASPGGWPTGGRAVAEAGAATASAVSTTAIAAAASMPTTGATTTSVASSAAPVLASPAASAPPATTLAALRASLRTEAPDEAAAWRLLAQHWGQSLPPGEACAVAAASQLQCFRATQGLALLRLLDRPAMLLLRDGAVAAVPVLLVGLGPQTAWLQTATGTRSLPLTDLAAAWRGEFATLWRAPAAYRSAQPQTVDGPLAPWLAEHLAGSATPVAAASAAGGDRALRERLVAFQRAQGLDPDGLPGPLTLMALNRATGVSEPRLATSP